MLKKELNPITGARAYLFAVTANLAVQIFVAVVLAAATVLSGGSALNVDIAESAPFNFSVMLLIQAGFTLVYYLVVNRGGFHPLICFKNKTSPLNYIFAVILGFVSILAFYPLTLLFSGLIEKTGYTISALSDMKTPFDFILGIFVLLIAAPFGEELIFRSALISGIKKDSGYIKAVLLSALAFCFMHMSPSQTMYQFLLGIVLGFAALITRSVAVPMIIHSVSNLTALLLDYTALGNFAEKIVLGMPSDFIAVLTGTGFTAVFGAIIVLILFLMKKFHAKTTVNLKLESLPLAENEQMRQEMPKESKEKDPSSKQARFIYFAALGICIIMWIVSLLTGIFGKAA